MTTLTLNSGSNIFQTGGAGNAPATNPYSTFSTNVQNMLSQAQGLSQQGNNALRVQGQNLQNQALNESNPSSNLPFSNLMVGMSGGAMLGSEGAVQDAFKPGQLSIQNQIAANTDAMNAANTEGNTFINAAGQAATLANAGIGKYSPMINPSTGQMDGYNSATGQWASAVQGGGQGSTPLQLGQTDWAAYNGNSDPDYSTKMQAATSTIQAQMPTFDPTTADQYIQMHSPKSPLTGQMFLQAANAYGIDPTKLMAQAGLESMFGTSAVAEEDNNPGGIKFAGQNGAIQGTMVTDGTGGFYAKFDNLQDGLYAQAKLIAGYTGGNPLNAAKTPPAPAPQISSSGAPVAPSGKTAQTIYQGADINSKAALGFTSTGMLYMDSSKIPTSSAQDPGSTVDANSFASRNNIPILSPDQVAIVKGADEAINNITKVIAPAWEKVAPGNSLDALVGSAEHPLSSLFNTDWAANVKTFKSNTENIAQQIHALSQSAPKLGLISTAEAALPVLDYNFIGGANPSNFDTLKAGETKMQRTLDLLGQTVSELVPGYQAPTLPFSTSAGGSSSANSGVTPSGISYTVTN